MNKKMMYAALLAAVFVLAAGGRVHAQVPSLYEAVQTRPYFDFTQEYRSNIYLEADDTTSDLISIFRPGIEFYLPQRNGALALDYAVGIRRYWDRTRENTERHQAALRGNWRLGSNMRLQARNHYDYTDDPATSELTALERRQRNRFEVSLDWQGNRVGFEPGFTSIRDNYRTLDQLDRREDFFWLTGYTRVMPQTDFLVRYRLGTVRYDEVAVRKSSYHELTTGFRGVLSPKITGEARAGFKWRDYRDPGRRDFSGLVVHTGLEHQASERARTNLVVERGVEESSFVGNDYYTMTRLGLDYRHLLARRHEGRAGLSYERASYPVGGRGDNTWDLHLGWGMQLNRRARLGAGYRLRYRDSSQDFFDYRDHLLSVNYSLSF